MRQARLPLQRFEEPAGARTYYQLSFTWRGKGRTGFVRTEHLAEVRQKLANYKRFRELTDDWVDLVVDGAARTGEKPVGRWKSILRTYRRK